MTIARNKNDLNIFKYDRRNEKNMTDLLPSKNLFLILNINKKSKFQSQ